jgi:hypothetical protein
MLAVDEERLRDLVEHFYRAFLAADREAIARFVTPEAAWLVRLDTAQFDRVQAANRAALNRFGPVVQRGCDSTDFGASTEPRTPRRQRSCGLRRLSAGPRLL